MITIILQVKLDGERFLDSEMADIHGPSLSIGQALATELALILEGSGVVGQVEVLREEGGLPPVRVSIPYDVVICTMDPECYGSLGGAIDATTGQPPTGVDGGVDTGGVKVLFPTSRAAALVLGVRLGQRLVIPTGDLRGWTLLINQTGLTIGEDRRGRGVVKAKEDA